MTEHLLSDELILPDLPAQSRHPMDSSGILLGLMALSRQAEAADSTNDESDSLEKVISKGVLRSLLSALHFRDVTTVRHARRVAILSVGMARHLSWEGRQLKLLEIAALLHDIGKIGVPDNILFKPGKLSPDEAELMALHHNIGVDVLQACRVDAEVLDIISQSHRYYDGISDGEHHNGSDVHQGARILAVADAYESLSTEQVYREAKSHDEIMAILMDSAGTQFDGNIVCALSRWVESEGIPFSDSDAGQQTTDQLRRAPVQPEETLEANSLCHIFSYLYLLESLYDGFYLVDSDLRFVIWNRGSEKLIGHPPQELLGQVRTSRILNYADKYGEPLPDHERPLHKVIESRKAVTSEIKIQHSEGRWIDVELQTVPLIDQHGQLQGVAEIFRDLSRSHRRPREFRELKQAASRDALTSVANRGELETQLALLVSDFSQQSAPNPFSAIFIDIDHFKSINDTFGHTVGDTVLVEVARLLQHETYSGELVGRYGGEEFVILCPETDLDQAVKRAERLRLALCSAEIDELSESQLTASFGVTEAEPGDSVESIFRRADKALYMAKRGGRNQTQSLTNQQLLVGESTVSEKEAETSPKILQYSGSFFACIAADLVIYKLGGFVNDTNSKLVEVTPKRVVIRLGSRGILPFWGRSDERRPVELELEFGEENSDTRRKYAASRNIQVSVKIRPLGWIRDNDIFQERTKRVMKSLKSYFVADLFDD